MGKDFTLTPAQQLIQKCIDTAEATSVNRRGTGEEQAKKDPITKKTPVKSVKPVEEAKRVDKPTRKPKQTVEKYSGYSTSEKRSERLQAVLTPTLLEELQKITNDLNIKSVNETVNIAIAEFIRNHSKER